MRVGGVEEGDLSCDNKSTRQRVDPLRAAPHILGGILEASGSVDCDFIESGCLMRGWKEAVKEVVMQV